jgi:hypothetical protein
MIYVALILSVLAIILWASNVFSSHKDTVAKSIPAPNDPPTAADLNNGAVQDPAAVEAAVQTAQGTQSNTGPLS